MLCGWVKARGASGSRKNTSYDFSLFDRALELCQKHELKAIMGTPTYTPPAWLTERYPEVLRDEL